ncbi:MAG: sulfurtransferase TusA family protein [Clostridia bacterium]|nr:sulfurtransferase TusA family protein [Clostridia bacterium]MDD4048277.1 sulfurtransferase TusA family protein [Clostridia bacterium]
MVIKQIDTRGLSCPQPVIKTKKGMQENPEGVEVIVDNTTAKINIERFAKLSGYKVESRKNDAEYVIKVERQ